MSAPMLEIRLFGPLNITRHNEPLPRLRSRTTYWLLALLALRQGREVSREWLAGTLWPESEQSLGYYNLRRCLTNLRQALGTASECLLSPTPQTLSLAQEGVWVDVVAFDTAIKQGDANALEKAIALYVGPLLEDCPEEWVPVERTAREQSYLAVLDTLATQAIAQGNLTEAIRYLRLLIVANPLREESHCRLMQALANCGDYAAVTQVYRDLRQRFHRELNTAPAPHTDALYQRLRADTKKPSVLAVAPVPRQSDQAARRLPVPLTSLVGRERPIEEVVSWLKHNRLVTLLGTGGVGKTRLSIAVGEAIAGAFPEGVWFVELAALTDPELVAQTVTTTLGIPEQAGKSALDTLTERLSSRSLLLILDNCEHLIESCALLASHLLTTCPGVSVLASSRHPLGISGELRYRVPSLEAPTAGQINETKEVSGLLEYSGLRLFVDRALLMKQDFRLTRDNVAAVCGICQHLDGIPLAIELVAARMHTLSVEAIYARLNDRFHLLTGGDRTRLPRQKTLRALIDWSYDLLTPQEKLLLHRVSVFAGGWTLESAERVCSIPAEDGHTGIEVWEVLDVLSSLVDKSLVVHEENAGASRYRLLETVGQYAREHLKASGEEATWRKRHLAHFAAWTEEVEPNLAGADQKAYLDHLETEHDNLRAALDWSGSDPESASAGLRLAAAVWRFWQVRGHLSEGRERLARVLAGESVRDRAIRAKALFGAGVIAQRQYDIATARPLIEESIAIYQEIGDRRGFAFSLRSLGNIALTAGDYARARALYEESLAICRELGDRIGMAGILGNMGNLGLGQGDYSSARLHYEEAIAIFRELGDRYGLAIPLLNLGILTAKQGDNHTARTLFAECLAIQWELGERRGVVLALMGLAEVTAILGSPLRAAQLWGAAERLREEIGLPHSPHERQSYEQDVAATRTALGDDAAFDAAWAEGRALPLPQVIELALGERG